MQDCQGIALFTGTNRLQEMLRSERQAVER